MTEVIYGPARFSFVRTVDVQSAPQQDPAGIDLVCTAHTISIEAVIAVGDLVGGWVPGELPADTLARVQHLLEAPRRRFTYKVGGRILFDISGQPNDGARDQDATIGPVPQVHGIKRVTDLTFVVTWSVTVYTRGCKDVRQTFASLRWVQTHTIDDRQYSTLRMTGRLMCTRDMLQGLASIDDLRWVVTPPVPPDFIRTTSEWTILADGLAAEFSFVDEEQYIVPPAGAVKLKGTFTRSTNNFGAMYVAEARVKLTGKKETPKPTLMGMAVSIALDKLTNAGPATDKSGNILIKDGAFSEILEQNEVEVILRAQVLNTPASDNSKTVESIAQGIGRGAVAIATPPILIPFVAAKQVADELAKQKQAADAPPPPDKKKPPAVGGLDLGQFSGVLPGCSVPPQTTGIYVPGAGIAPDLYGHLPQLRLLAAAFNDPCLAQSVARASRKPDTATLSTFNNDGQALTSGKVQKALSPSLTPESPGTSVVKTVAELPARMVSRGAVNYDGPGVWEEFACEMHYDYRSSKRVLPRTVSGLPGVTVQGWNDTCDLYVTWTATKNGSKPTIPSWADSADGNLVCTAHPVTTDEVELGPDGDSLKYTIGGRYEYSFVDASKADIRNAIPPWLPIDGAKLDPYPATDTITQGVQASSTLRSQQK